MKISLSLVYFLFCCLSTALHCLAQQAQTEGHAIPVSSTVKEQQTGSESSKKDTQQFVIRVKTKQKVDFSGTVFHVDSSTAALSIRSQGKTITFDMSKVILIGYKSTGEIKQGDTVSVGYTQFGLQVQKGSFAVTRREKNIPHQEATFPKAVAKIETAKPQRTTPVRMRDNRNPVNFKNIDNNKDGKITPIELCVLVPDLTLQKFKEYDKNKDGCLNESEFNGVKKTR